MFSYVFFNVVYNSPFVLLDQECSRLMSFTSIKISWPLSAFQGHGWWINPSISGCKQAWQWESPCTHMYIHMYICIYISGVYGTIIYKWWFVSLLCKSVCLFHVTVLVPLCPCWLLTNSEKELVAIAITCWYVCIIAAHYPTLCKTLPSNAHKICAFCILYDPKYIHQKSYFALYWWICFCLLVVFDSYATYITVYIWLYAYYVYKILLKLHLYILLHV